MGICAMIYLTISTSLTPTVTYGGDEIIQAGGRKMNVGDSLKVDDAELYLVRVQEYGLGHYYVVWNVYIDGKGFMGEVKWEGYQSPTVFKDHAFIYYYDLATRQLYVAEKLST